MRVSDPDKPRTNDSNYAFRLHTHVRLGDRITDLVALVIAFE